MWYTCPCFLCTPVRLFCRFYTRKKKRVFTCKNVGINSDLFYNSTDSEWAHTAVRNTPGTWNSLLYWYLFTPCF